jgi:hypothetical protein
MALMVLVVAEPLLLVVPLGVLVHPVKVITEDLVVVQAGHQTYLPEAVAAVVELEETVLVLGLLEVMEELEYKTFITLV